nr:sigma-70 family RNA polymerase sigma factor [Bacillus infantis]
MVGREQRTVEETLSEILLAMDREAAIDQIMQLYGQDILQLAYTYVKQKDVAEDLTQEIFIKCYKNLHQYNRKSMLKTWLWRIAVNHCKDYLRSWHNRHIILSEEQAKSGSGMKDEVEAAVIKKDDDSQLAAAVMNLPDHYREVIYLHYFEEMSIKEIAAVTGINQNTIKTRLKRAKQLLKERLEEL